MPEVTHPPASGSREDELRAEARHFNAALFAMPPSPDIEAAYVRSHEWYCDPKADGIDLAMIVRRKLDVEALELVLRGRNPVLSRKFRILVYLNEATPQGYGRLVNRRDRRIRAWASLLLAGLRTSYKYAKGQLLYRMYRIA